MNSSVAGSQTSPKLYVVTGDAAVVEPIDAFRRESGVEMEAFRSIDGFTAAHVPERPSCLVVDIEAPGGVEIATLESIHARRVPVSVVALGENLPIPLVVRVLKAGASNFLEKPVETRELFDTLHRALEEAGHTFDNACQWTEFEKRLAALTNRQREILRHIVLGKPNKLIGYDLGISERTVEVHRYRLLRTMRVSSAVELARLAGAFQITLGREVAA